MVSQFLTAAAPYVMMGLVIAIYCAWFNTSEQNKEGKNKSSGTGKR